MVSSECLPTWLFGRCTLLKIISRAKLNAINFYPHRGYGFVRTTFKRSKGRLLVNETVGQLLRRRKGSSRAKVQILRFSQQVEGEVFYFFTDEHAVLLERNVRECRKLIVQERIKVTDRE